MSRDGGGKRPPNPQLGGRLGAVRMGAVHFQATPVTKAQQRRQQQPAAMSYVCIDRSQISISPFLPFLHPHLGCHCCSCPAVSGGMLHSGPPATRLRRLYDVVHYCQLSSIAAFLVRRYIPLMTASNLQTHRFAPIRTFKMLLVQSVKSTGTWIARSYCPLLNFWC